jgi:hypothetical protein
MRIEQTHAFGRTCTTLIPESAGDHLFLDQLRAKDATLQVIRNGRTYTVPVTKIQPKIKLESTPVPNNKNK